MAVAVVGIRGFIGNATGLEVSEVDYVQNADVATASRRENNEGAAILRASSAVEA
jgi:hypothetical protein